MPQQPHASTTHSNSLVNDTNIPFAASFPNIPIFNTFNNQQNIPPTKLVANVSLLTTNIPDALQTIPENTLFPLTTKDELAQIASCSPATEAFLLSLAKAQHQSKIECNLGIEHDIKIDAILTKNSFVREKVGGDGNCFFYCLSRSIYGDDSHHRQLLTMAVHHLIANYDRFRCFYGGDIQQYFQYCKTLNKDGIWADQLLIRAASISSKRNIIVYTIENYLVTNTIDFPVANAQPSNYIHRQHTL